MKAAVLQTRAATAGTIYGTAMNRRPQLMSPRWPTLDRQLRPRRLFQLPRTAQGPKLRARPICFLVMLRATSGMASDFLRFMVMRFYSTAIATRDNGTCGTGFAGELRMNTKSANWRMK